MRGRYLAFPLAFVLCALALPVAAQSTRIAVSVPYDFMVGSRKLAAGQYLINRPIPTDPRVLGFRGNAKHQKAVVTTNPRTNGEAAASTELVFARYGDTYFLRSVSIRGVAEVYELPITKAEKAAAAKGEPEMVTLKADGE
jgi:hypothetical protein